MLFKYKATTPDGQLKEGGLEAASVEIAVSALQKRNLIIVSLKPVKEGPFFSKDIFSALQTVKKRDVVLFSRKISTLFEAKVPILRSLKMLATESEKPALGKILEELSLDIEGGAKISEAMAKHPEAFSLFYVNMVRAGEESGKLDEVFKYLADYLERSYEISSKALRALVYPAFVVSAFAAVMILMITIVVPKLGDMISESGTEPPFYTKIVLGISDVIRSYGIFVLILIAVGAFVLWRYSRTKSGKLMISNLQLSMPLIGNLYKKLYLSRITDTLQTLIMGGVSMVRSLEITTQIVENDVYQTILKKTVEAVKGGSTISESLSRYKEIPPLVSQMIKIGEETGKLDFVLKTVARYYRNEVDSTLETLVALIEPIMIVFLGVGVGILLASVLMPIYNIALNI